MAGKAKTTGGSKAKGRKIGRNSLYCKTYKAAGLEEKNQKRRIRRHILNNPEDKTAMTLFEQRWGHADQIRVSMLGKVTDRTMTGHARRKMTRKYDQKLQERLKNSRTIRRQNRKIVAEKLRERDGSTQTLPSATKAM